MIYLDNAATTKVDPRVKEAMDAWSGYANAGSVHALGVEAKRQVDKARNVVAEMLNCEPEQVLFTSGGSESNATVFHGLKAMNRWSRFAVSSVEHESVRLNAIMASIRLGAKAPREIPVIPALGTVDLDVLERTLEGDRDIKLVSVMGANNEICASNDICSISDICHAHKVQFHTDCVQAVGTTSIDTDEIGCDFMSLSAHKFHGPKGIGILFCRDKSAIIPLISGGLSQEFGFRGGTENVPAIIGLGVAASIAIIEELVDTNVITRIKLSFYERLLKKLFEIGGEKACKCVHYNGGHITDRGKIVSLRFDGVDSQTLVMLLSGKGVYVSSGSACNAHSSESSKVLLAIGLNDAQAHSTVRFSFSKMNTVEEVERAADVVAQSVMQLMNM